MKKKIITMSLAALFLVAGLTGCGNKNTGDNNDNSSNKVASGDSSKSSQDDIEKLKALKSDPLMILANKDTALGSSYVPEGLVTSEIPFQDIIVTRQLKKEAADAAKEMFDAAKADGIELLGASGYRSYDVQVNLYNSNVQSMGEEKAAQLVAKPGTSEHQTGLALDILSKEYGGMDEGFDTTKSYEWLKNNCYKYGFILRYPKDKVSVTKYAYEPWHYRYLGHKDVAEEIMKNNMVFEEYLQKLNEKIGDN